MPINSTIPATLDLLVDRKLEDEFDELMVEEGHPGFDGEGHRILVLVPEKVWCRVRKHIVRQPPVEVAVGSVREPVEVRIRRGQHVAHLEHVDPRGASLDGVAEVLLVDVESADELTHTGQPVVLVDRRRPVRAEVRDVACHELITAVA